jgi:hypothetical protein
MQVADFVAQVGGFDGLPPREKIQLFAWFLHTHRGQEVFDSGGIRVCFDELHALQPNVALYLTRMLEAKPPDLIKVRGGFKLERQVRVALDQKYGVHQSVIAISNTLADLPAKVPSLTERTFLDEALKCYRAQAFRACCVMTWNLAYNHLLKWLLADPKRLAQFNVAIVKRNSKKSAVNITKYDDFEELKEREVIDICNIANLFNSGIYKILVAKLDRRNIAAHPSAIVITQPQADDMIADLVNNVVLALT